MSLQFNQLLTLTFVMGLLLATLGRSEDATATAVPEELKISPPDIYPYNSKIEYHGEVEIRMVANQPHSVIFYTTDGTTPIDHITASNKLYTDPFKIVKAGTWVVKAMAFPKFPPLRPSRLRNQTVVVSSSDIPSPVLFPPDGQYRGSINLVAKRGGGLDKYQDEIHKFQYVIDLDEPGEMWQTFDPAQGQGILLDTPGRHRVYVRAVVGNGSEGRTSPSAQYIYLITPTLLYDVFSSCPKCANNEPVVGQLFTVYLQNPASGSLLWLTTSSKGCEKTDSARHILDDTKVISIAEHKAFYSFFTKGDPQPKVFVCLNESVADQRQINSVPITKSGDAASSAVPFAATKVPRRVKPGDNVISDGSFAIDAATGAIDPNLANYKPPAGPPSGPSKFGKSSGNGDFGDIGSPPTFDSGSAFSMITFIMLLVVVVVFIVALSRMMTMREAAAAAERASAARAEVSNPRGPPHGSVLPV